MSGTGPTGCRSGCALILQADGAVFCCGAVLLWAPRNEGGKGIKAKSLVYNTAPRYFPQRALNPPIASWGASYTRAGAGGERIQRRCAPESNSPPPSRCRTRQGPARAQSRSKIAPKAAQHAPADKYDATPYVSRLIRLPHLVCLYRSGTAAGPADPARDPRRPKKTGRTAKLEEARSIRYV